jgi:hypothetical protein
MKEQRACAGSGNELTLVKVVSSVMALQYSEYEDRYGSTFNGLPPWLKVESYLDSYD